MHVHPRMVSKKTLNSISLMRRKIVQNHMNLFFVRLARNNVGEKGDKLGAGMTLCGLTQDLTALGVKSSIKRQSSVAIVLKAMTLGSSRRQRQDRIFTIQCLNGRLLIDREHRRVLGWMKVQPDHVRSFSLEINIVTAHVTVHAVGPDAVLGPYTGNGHVRDIAQFQRQFTPAPVRRAVRGLFLQRPFKNPRLLALALGSSDSTCMPRVQTGQSLDQKSLFPTSNEIGVATELLANRPIAFPVGDQQYQSSAARLRRISTLPSYPTRQLLSFTLFQRDCFHQPLRRFSCVTIH